MAALTKSNGDAAASSGTPSKNIPAIANPLAGDSSEIASNINYHAKFSPHFSPVKFEPEQAFFAAAESVRDRLIQVFLKKK